ncbi:hypothetical protein M9Q43_04495 [Flavobacterium sp. HXWNR29]|uniref:hypothetical protein n=1 Tax=Flavobacterium odoriferum TaxID=2946604 RepID=UPI0021CB5F7B|nr:hypothetical protein [Flavobacterium sp. HXWNR29]MCU4188423.1 hypothetical protein [Flavobacterium sp. HXWNR29]
MEDKNLEMLFNLNEKAKNILQSLSSLSERDIRKVYFNMFSSQVIINYLNYKINVRFSETNRDEFLDFFKSDLNQVHNYTYNITQFIGENILSTALFQTELVFRFYYSKFTNESPSKERNLFKIVSFLYDDIQNNWKKDECNLIVLLWTLRNTIHTGGLYFENINGRKLNYKNQEYIFEYGKNPKFLIEQEGIIIELISDLFDALNSLFKSEKIQKLEFIEHPVYSALEI